MKMFLVLLLLVSSQAFATAKIGFVNVQKIISSIKEGKSVVATLEKSFNSKKAILKGDEDKIKKAQEDYKKQSMVLSEKARLQKEKEIQESMMALQKKTMDFQKEIQQQEGELKKPILEKLKVVVDEICKTEGIDIAFEVSAAPIYAKERIDLTDKVIAGYDKKHK
jgi:outer membrane protein